jgi:DNA polymerase-3 subunit delta
VNYILYGNEHYLINKYVKKLSKTILGDSLDDFNYVRLSFLDDDIKEISDQLSSLNLGYDSKVIVLNDCDFLSKKSSKTDSNEKIIETFVLRNDPEISLLMICNQKSIEKSNVIVDFINKNGKVIEAITLNHDQWITYIKDHFLKDNIKVSDEAIEEILYRTNLDLELFENSYAKLKQYSNEITLEDVKNLISEPLDENNFNLLNFLLSNKIDKALKTFRDLKTNGVEPAVLVAMLTTQLKLNNQIYYLSKIKGLNNFEIGNQLKITDKRVYAIMKSSYRLNDNSYRNIFSALYELDKTIKTGRIDRFTAFEMFILNFNKLL